MSVILCSVLDAAVSVIAKHVVAKTCLPSSASTAVDVEQRKIFVRDLDDLLTTTYDARWAKITLVRKANKNWLQGRPGDLSSEVDRVCVTRREMKRAANKALKLTKYQGLLKCIENEFDNLLKNPKSTEASIHATYEEIEIAISSLNFTAGH